MKKLLYLSAFVVLCLSSTSCASIFTKSTYPISISTDPVGADIKITNRNGAVVFTGQTPVTAMLKSSRGYMSGENYTITLSKAGYTDNTVIVSSTIEGWYFGNILLGGIIGMLIVDPLTGAMYKLNDDPIHVTLKSQSASAEPTLQIIDINSLSDDQKKNLVELR